MTISSILKNLLPNRLRAYEAIADKAMAFHESYITLTLLPGAAAYDLKQLRTRAQAGGPEETRREGFLTFAAAYYRAIVHQALGVKLYRSQLIAALALADGYLLEMGTGEGKTLVAPLAAWLTVARGGTVHVVTANEYLAQRDANQMLPVYQAMELSVAVTLVGQPIEIKRQAYTFDVVYGTATVFALDKLFDEVVVHPGHRLNPRGLAKATAIVDEADQVLIDEAKTPVVYSTNVPADASAFQTLIGLVEPLQRGLAPSAPGAVGEDGDFWLDLDNKAAVLTERGYETVTAALRAAELLAPADPDYGAQHQHLLLLATGALGARELLKRDVHYTVQDGQIVLIDALTGRLLPGRRWDSGMQQMLEAKEGLAISDESIVMGRITLQNFFKLYGGICGMSGTIMADAEEFLAVYGLRAAAVPRNVPSRCENLPDVFCRTKADKLEYLAQTVSQAYTSRRPVLVAVSHAEQAQQVADVLRARGLAPRVLTATNHTEEAEIFARAGEKGAITVVTSLAGRGVDIKLGGDARAMFDFFRQLLELPLGEVGPDECQRQRSRAVELTAELSAFLGSLDVIGAEINWSKGQAERDIRFAFDDAEELACVLRYFDADAPQLAAGREVLGRFVSAPEVWAQNAVRFRHEQGLFVIGFEHFESERADQQLRGRTGRQGDPGTTLFLTSLDDSLLVDSGSGEELRRLLAMVGSKATVENGGASACSCDTEAAPAVDPLEEKLCRKMIMQEQRIAQGRAAAARQQLVKFDAALELHRQVYQELRQQVLLYEGGAQAFVDRLIADFAQEMGQVLKARGAQAVVDEFAARVQGMDVPMVTLDELERMDHELELDVLVADRLQYQHIAALNQVGEQDRATFERYLVLSEMDLAWSRHLEELTALRRGIHLRGHAKQDPHIVFEKDAYTMFETFLAAMHTSVLTKVLSWKDGVGVDLGGSPVPDPNELDLTGKGS
ncbi:DEAD/DEAH box helicase [Achromobacter xylosoxidans]